MKKLKLPLSVSIAELQTGDIPLFDAGLNIVTGKHAGYSVINKFGRTPDLQVEELPEDVWDGHSAYSGFPTGAPEKFEVFSSSPADKGLIFLQYLADETAEGYATASVRLNGTSPVVSEFSGHRMHTARYDGGHPTALNAGAITVRHSITKQNVFCIMPQGRGQTACAAITVPANHTGYVVRLFARAYGNEASQVDGGLWIRDRGQSPRMRRPFLCSAGVPFEEKPFGGILILSGGDVVVRVTGMSTPLGGVVTAGFDIVFVKNA